MYRPSWPEQGRACIAHHAGGLQRLVARLHRARAGDQREMVTTHLAPADVHDGAFATTHLRGGQLVGLEDGHDLGHAGRALELEAGDVLAVADGADDGHLVAPAQVSARTHRLDPLYDLGDLVLGRRRFHDDHHRFFLSSYAWRA
jgi:hypothetical protein